MKPNAQKILSRLKSKQAKVAIIGLGYVGLPLALAFARKKFKVTGVDIDERRVNKILGGQSYVEDIPSKVLSRAVQSGKLKASVDPQALKDADVIVVCVPTPLNRVKDPDLSNILEATEAIRSCLRGGQLIILESTTYPGTTEEVVQPALEKSGLKAGEDFFLCFSPERIDPGNKKFPLNKIPKVVGGINPVSTRLGCAFYAHVTSKVIPVSSARTAEMAKLLENTFRIVNIGLINELAQAAEHLKINIWEAVEAASSKPFGFMPFYPGPGIGGHCIGVDPIYLSWKARLQGVDLHFIELARRVNAQMPHFVVERAVFTLNARLQKAISGSKILVLGVAYKRDVADTRESPAFEILHGLKKLGARVNYHDPYVPEIKNERLSLRSLGLTPANLRSQDLVMVVTDHSGVNYGTIAKYARLIFDTRNISHPSFSKDKVVRL